jgi:hypothetical protein
MNEAIFLKRSNNTDEFLDFQQFSSKFSTSAKFAMERKGANLHTWVSLFRPSISLSPQTRILSLSFSRLSVKSRQTPSDFDRLNTKFQWIFGRNPTEFRGHLHPHVKSRQILTLCSVKFGQILQ